MAMKRKLGVDTGKFATKAVRAKTSSEEAKRLKILSRIDMLDVDFGALNKDTYRIEYNGQKYRIGEGATEESFTETKMEEIHRISLYTAIALMVENEDSVVVGIGCPLSLFVNKKAREEYRIFMIGEQDIEITVNGKKHHFYISNIFVFPESCGAVYVHSEKYEHSTVGVIDFGGLDTQGMVYRELAPVVGSNFTVTMGGKILRTQLRDELNGKLALDMPIADYQMDEILKNGYVSNRRYPEKEELSKKIIHDFLYFYVQQVYLECVKHKWSLDTIKLAFQGGTSEFLMDVIKEVFKVKDDSFFEDSEWLNAEAYLLALG